MSAISTAYDSFRTLLAATFPTHKELTNPYEVEDNDDKHLEKGYGLTIDAAENTNGEIGKVKTIKREIKVVLTRKMFGRDGELTKQINAVKSLLEDQALLITAVEGDPYLTTEANYIWIADNGIEFVYNGTSYLKIVNTFEVNFFETY